MHLGSPIFVENFSGTVSYFLPQKCTETPPKAIAISMPFPSSDGRFLLGVCLNF